MNILLLGSGGREDALAWRLKQSPSCETLIAAPGNPGIARWADCVAIDPCDLEAVVKLALDRAIDLLVIGPEAPLVAGVADAARSAGIAGAIVVEDVTVSQSALEVDVLTDPEVLGRLREAVTALVEYDAEAAAA